MILRMDQREYIVDSTCTFLILLSLKKCMQVFECRLMIVQDSTGPRNNRKFYSYIGINAFYSYGVLFKRLVRFYLCQPDSLWKNACRSHLVSSQCRIESRFQTTSISVKMHAGCTCTLCSMCGVPSYHAFSLYYATEYNQTTNTPRPCNSHHDHTIPRPQTNPHHPKSNTINHHEVIIIE